MRLYLKRQFTKFCLLLLLLVAFNLDGQDPVYSQYYSAPLQLNPAFAGNTDYPLFHVNYRLQWPSLAQAYTTYSASYDQYFDKTKSGLGFHVLSDDAGNGILKTVKFSGMYSYRILFGRDYNLKIGLEAGYIQSRLDWNKLVFSDQLDPTEGLITNGGSVIPSSETAPEQLNSGMIDISSGVLLYNPLYYVGISFKHLNNPKNSLLGDSQSFVGLPTRISLHAGMQINFDPSNKREEGSFISPSVMLLKQGGFHQMNIGSYGSFRNLLLGFWYRTTFNNSDAVIFTAGAKLEDVKLQYSYDYTISDIGIITGGTHEISLKMALESLGPEKSKYNDCLSLFR